MLDWKEIKGYDIKKNYRWQEDTVELPELEEEILIEFVDDIRPDRPPFVGYFKQNDTGVWMINSSTGGTLYEIQDGIKWARFNRS